MNSKELFESGLNCAQSVLAPFAKTYFPTEELALKIMSPFGGGISGTDNICGAVTGAIAAIGLHFGHANSEDTEQKQKCANATKLLIERFKSEHKSISCSRLIGYNLSKENEREAANEAGIFKQKCPILVESAARIAQDIINQD